MSINRGRPKKDDNEKHVTSAYKALKNKKAEIKRKLGNGRL
jgi:hypothetical protein